MKIDHQEIEDTNFYSINGRMALLIKDALHRERTIIHTSICSVHTSPGSKFYGSIIWQEKA